MSKRRDDIFRGEEKIPVHVYEERAGVIIGERYVYPDKKK